MNEEFLDVIMGAMNLKSLLEGIQITIGQLQTRHRLLADEENINHDVGEYCYHLASVLLETQKLLAGQEFSANYIEEHCNTLMRYSKIINKEQSSFP